MMAAPRSTSLRPSEISLPISSAARRERLSLRSDMREAARATILARSRMAILDQMRRYVLSAVASALRTSSSVCRAKLRSTSPLAGLTLRYSMVGFSADALRMLFVRRVRVGEGEACDLVLPHEHHAALLARVIQELAERAHPSRDSRDPVVRTDGHHAATRPRLFVQGLEIGLELGDEPVRGQRRRVVANDIVVAQCIGHHDERLSAHRHHERLVAAHVVYVVEEAEVLQDLQRVRRTAEPEGVEADRPRGGRPLERA